MIEEKFKENDIVEWCGVRGVVNNVERRMFISVWFEGSTATFYADGRYCAWHKEPSLILIERPKKKVKKTFYFASWETEKSDIRGVSYLCESKEPVQKSRGLKDFQLHEIEIEIDVEE